MKQQKQLGINVIGHLTGEFGLGEGARRLLKSMEAVGIPFKVIKDVKVGWHRNLDKTYSEEVLDQDYYPINLVYTNPDAHIINNIISSLGYQYFQNQYNIGFWAWELRKFPPDWEFAFDLFDEIWTLSNHCAESISAVSPLPVIKVMPSLELPKPSLKRNELNLPEDKFIFLFMFDFHSSLERKNPTGTIEAFKRAFGKSNEDVVLLIKSSNAKWQTQKRDLLYSIAEGWPSIQFMDAHLSKTEVNSLIYNCDCYVSLHRAEGFGLTPAEAMFYGKPVIATGYSSNIEFMNVANSFLVKYDLVATPEGVAGLYRKGDIWAEPDIDHAASLMRYIFNNYQEALKVGEKASRNVRSLLSPQAIGKVAKSRLELIMTKLEVSRLSQDFYQLKSEKEWYESQVIAWKQTARNLQKELKFAQSEIQKAQLKLEDLQTKKQAIGV